ncbi:metal-dependent hydrolase [Candidatus Kapaibacterium sp.]
MTIQYLGHSCFLLSDGKQVILIDPFITGNPNAPCSADSIDTDYIILTHGHGDHIGDTISIASRCNSTVIAVNELGLYLSEFGLIVHRMHIGGAYFFEFGRVKFTIAHHGSSNNEGKYMGEPAGVVITIGNKKIYHCGDTGLFLDMKLIGEIDEIDVMMPPIGDNFTMGIDDAVRAVEFVKPKLVIPMHYNTFPVIKADPYKFKEKAEKNNFKCKVMDFGEIIEVL